ncbi:MAG: HAD family hydrolase [Clostridiales bacterium]|nr:HAD family hydrolase [Clostridiales bacterium]
MKHAAVIFNLEGTLLDTLEDLTAVVNKTLKDKGYPEKTPEEIKKCVGNNMGELIRAAVPKGTTWEESYDLIEPCYKAYAESNTGNNKPYDGIIEMLDALCKEDVKIAIISNKPEETAKELCKQFFGDRAAIVIGEKEDVKALPAPDLIFGAAKEMGVLLNHIVFVGNTKADVQAAKNAGVDGIAVSWGFKDRTYLENHAASTIADTPAELIELI